MNISISIIILAMILVEERKERLFAAQAKSLAERAFNMASSSNIAIMHLQRLLQGRPPATATQLADNEIAKKEVMEDLGGTSDYAGFDWLYPILSDEEREVLDKVIEEKAKMANAGDRAI